MEALEIPLKPMFLKPFQNPTFSIKQNPTSILSLNPLKTSHPQRCRFVGLRSPSIQHPTRRRLSTSEANPVVSEEEATAPLKEKLGVVVKPMEKPRVVLKFIWMKRVIGLALDQVIPRHGTIPLTPYHFWPKEDSLKRLKVLLKSKPWISRRQLNILLDQATDIITLWQDNAPHSMNQPS